MEKKWFFSNRKWLKLALRRCTQEWLSYSISYSISTIFYIRESRTLDNIGTKDKEDSADIYNDDIEDGADIDGDTLTQKVS